MSRIRRLRRGEYDLVNISIIGYDPITGRSYEECGDEWRAWAEKVEAEAASLRWWQLIARLRLGWRTAVLYERLGAPPGFLSSPEGDKP